MLHWGRNLGAGAPSCGRKSAHNFTVQGHGVQTNLGARAPSCGRKGAHNFTVQGHGVQSVSQALSAGGVSGPTRCERAHARSLTRLYPRFSKLENKPAISVPSRRRRLLSSTLSAFVVVRRLPSPTSSSSSPSIPSLLVLRVKLLSMHGCRFNAVGH